MNKETLEKRVDDIISNGGDSEACHSQEDSLHLEVIMQFCPDWVKDEIIRLSNADFERWCA